jgi:hypothetical protein
VKYIRVIPFHVNSDTYESCRDAKFRVSTGLYLYQGFCETVLALPSKGKSVRTKSEKSLLTVDYQREGIRGKGRGQEC